MAITYGMSVKEFWEDNPDLFWAYRFSYYQRLKISQEYDNFKCWLQGAYFYEGVSVALANSFSKQNAKYPEKPYSLNEEKKKVDMKIKQEELVNKIKNRISEMQKIKGENNSTKERD